MDREGWRLKNACAKKLNVTNPPIITVVGKAFFDIGHSLKDQTKNRRRNLRGYAVWEIHPVMKMEFGLMRLIPLPKCRMIRHDWVTNMIPLPSYSQIAELIKKGATLEAQEQIMKLREAAIELQEENLKLREENKRLREERELATNLHFEGHVYWLLKDGQRTGPFCAACYDEHHRLSRLHDGRRYVSQTNWVCVVCNRAFD